MNIYETFHKKPGEGWRSRGTHSAKSEREAVVNARRAYASEYGSSRGVKFAAELRRGSWSPNSARKNPTKKQKREKARKASVQRRVAVALAKFLKQANPAMETAGATVTKLKGGGFTIRPIKAVKRGRR